MSSHYTDRHGTPLTVGQCIRVQRCIGRYGQTELIEGRIKILSPYGGATLEQAVRIHRPSQHGEFLGDYYVTLTRDGYEKFDDFEHGHEKWTEVIG